MSLFDRPALNSLDQFTFQRGMVLDAAREWVLLSENASAAVLPFRWAG